jgi:hypothetical protein
VDTPDWIFDTKNPKNLETVQQRMTERFLRIDETIREQQIETPLSAAWERP